MKPELIIHIGRPKVGSTALQAFLNQNRAALLKRGVCYPKTGLYHGASHHFSLVFLPGLPDYPVVKDLAPADLYQALGQEIADNGASRAVISSENFWLIKPEKLRPYLSDKFSVKIIAYLRRQDDVLVSSFIQEIRGGALSLDTPMEEYLQDKGRLKLLDYDAILGRWEKVFGSDRVQARLYEDIAEGQGIESDFLTALGIDSTAGFTFGESRRNRSPALDMLKLVEVLRTFPVGEVSHRQLSGILSEVSGQLGEPEDYAPERLMSDPQRQQVIARFADSNARLFARYGGSGFPPFTPRGLAAPSTVDLQLDRNQLALLGILAYQQRQIQILISRVSHLERQGQTAPAASLGSGAVRPGADHPRASTHASGGLLSRLLRRFGRK